MPTPAVLLAALMCVACAADDAVSATAAELELEDRIAVAYAEHRDEAVARLAAHSDDASAVAAALMLGMEHYGTTDADQLLVRELIARVDVATSTSAMALLRLLDERRLTMDERQVAVDRLLQIDRGNAAAWVHAVELAVERGAGGDEIDALLADAAVSAHTYATRLDETTRTIFHAFRAIPMPDVLRGHAMDGVGSVDADDHVAAAYSAGIALAVAMPHAVKRECTRWQVPAWQRRSAACIALARTMALNADTLIAETMGYAMWRGAAGDDPAIAELYRAMQWRRMAYVELAMTTARDVHMEEFVDRMGRAGRTEIDGMAAALRDAGIALQPPAGWHASP